MAYTRISSLNNVEDILKHYKENSENFTKDLVALSCRMIARNLREVSFMTLKNLETDPNYTGLMQRVTDNIGEFTEFGKLSLFWMKTQHSFESSQS